MSAAPQQPPLWHALLIATIGVVLLIGCWSAGPTAYDDAIHVEANEQVTQWPVWSVLMPKQHSTYFPTTVVSYKLDRALFSGWMPARLGSWIPGVRIMTFVYHAIAALILWQLMLRLALTPLQALFVALVFAAHPMACETVCWVSERKNALAALFCFAALWTWCLENRPVVRLLATTGLYALALMSKPSALGLLPILGIYELMGGKAGICENGPMQWIPSRAWIKIFLRTLPLIALSLAIVLLNMIYDRGTFSAPPGGSIFTAMLTDLEIVSRYVFNVLLPVSLSAVYFVDPVRSIMDVRVPIYGIVLAAMVFLSVRFASNPRRAAFGWLFFIGSLGPNLNLIALPHYMQDRYVYLGTPGLLIVVVEVAAGVSARLSRIRISFAPAAAYLALLVVLAAGRSYVWKDAAGIFSDAVEKQPSSAFAHYGFGSACAEQWNDLKAIPGADKVQIEQWHQKWLSQWKQALLCPDAGRYYCYWQMASTLAVQYAEANDFEQVEFCWKRMAYPPPGLADDPLLRSNALIGLAGREVVRSNFVQAFKLSQEAVDASDGPDTRLMRGRTAIFLAQSVSGGGDAQRARELFSAARKDLESIPKENPFYTTARELLSNPALSREL
jgi:hypothetical protein